MRTIYVDIDGTICQTEGTDYANAQPLPDRIAVVNRLCDAGNWIVFWSARGAMSASNVHGGQLWQMTRKQLEDWGVKYHELRLDKPLFDLLVDDRAVSSLTEVQ